MTLKEAIQAELGEISINDLSLKKVILDQWADILGSEDDAYLNILRTEYSSSERKNVDLAVRLLLKSILTNPDIVEGKFSIKQHRASILSRIRGIERMHGIESQSLNMVQRW